MDGFRREFLKLAGTGLVGATASTVVTSGARADVKAPIPGVGTRSVYDVRTFGASGDGKTIDSPAINKAIETAAAAGGGTVLFPSGVYASYSIRLKSNIALYLEQGATILAASTSLDGTTSGYDPAEPKQPWESYQDYGHNHWHNSLIWGESINNFAILGPGLIWGKGLSRGTSDKDRPRAETPGAGNKAIALKNCHNVILRDFSILEGGHFGILATGVDNLTIDNLKIDTNRDGMDIDCCRNVHVSNCSVNSPWDDGICPKSSFALGYARATENVTITNCYVTGDYQLGTLLDGTFKRFGPDFKVVPTGRIKCGTESNGGFKNITISNCVFESCRGFALETVDGALLEDVTFVGITMRDIRNSPLFLRLGTRMRGPQGVPVGTLKRIIMSNITSYGAVTELPSIISGVPGHFIEDIKINDVYFHQQGGGTKDMAALQPEEKADGYPEPRMFGTLPAHGFFIRHVKNIEFGNVEIASEKLDSRPAFWLHDVEGADFFRVKTAKGQMTPAFDLSDVTDFRVFGSRFIKDVIEDKIDRKQI
jgi:polygalacturonase